MTLDDLDDLWDVNVRGLIGLTQALLPMMTIRGRGKIINLGSLGTVIGLDRRTAYAATKGAVISMIRACAVELARYGVRANAVLPGWIGTEMTEGAFGWDKFRDAVMPRIPMRRWGRPEDFGGIAVYLMSDASAYHTADSVEDPAAFEAAVLERLVDPQAAVRAWVGPNGA